MLSMKVFHARFEILQIFREVILCERQVFFCFLFFILSLNIYNMCFSGARNVN